MAKRTIAASVESGYQLLPVIGPSAGVDLRTSPTLLPAQRARTLVNFSLTEPGALVVRPGYTLFSTSAALGSSGRMQGAARVYLNTATPNAASTIFTLAAWNGGIYNLKDNGAWRSTTADRGGLSTNEIQFVHDRDLVAAFDGLSTQIYKSTNGTAWTRFGIARPTVAPTLSTLSTGGLSSGEYEIGYSYKDRDLAFESNGSSIVSTITLSASSGAINVIVPNSADAQVDAIVIYARQKTSGETIRRATSSGPQSGGANSTFIVTSTSWTTNREEPTDHDLPVALSFGAVWKNRWWARDATVSNRIRFTQLFQAQSWPALFYIDIPFERGDAITAIRPLGDTLVIAGSTKLFVIYGQTSLDFTVKPALTSEDGAFGFRAIAQIENGLVHVGANGVYNFDGGSDRLLSFDLDPGWRDLVGNASAGDLAKIAVVYHPKQKELRISVPRLYPTATWGEWVLDLNRTRTTGESAWTATDRPIGGYILWDGPESADGNRNRLFTWDSSTPQIYEEAVGTSANSSNLTAQYAGPGLTLGPYRARWIDTRLEYEPNGGTFSIEPIVDGVSQGTQSVGIGAGLSVYGTATYGTGTYAGSGRRQAYRPMPLSAQGRTYQLKCTYAGQTTFRLFSYHVGMIPERRSRAFTE